MKAIIQRVCSGKVSVNNIRVGQINSGYVVLLGIKYGDDEEAAGALAQKLLNLRIMSDEQGKMNLSIINTAGEILVVPQFTLYADTSSRRPGFTQAAPPQEAGRLYEYFVAQLKKSGLKVANGQFGAYMQVELINDGPVTIVLEI